METDGFSLLFCAITCSAAQRHAREKITRRRNNRNGARYWLSDNDIIFGPGCVNRGKCGGRGELWWWYTTCGVVYARRALPTIAMLNYYSVPGYYCDWKFVLIIAPWRYPPVAVYVICILYYFSVLYQTRVWICLQKNPLKHWVHNNNIIIKNNIHHAHRYLYMVWRNNIMFPSGGY